MSDGEPRRLHLALSAGIAGTSQGAWRRPDSRSEEWGTVEYMIDLARATEAACFDAFFLSDLSSPNRELAAVQPPYLFFEPLTLTAALARETSRIGLIATASTTFHEPYNLARQVATLDHISGGRVGWNAVTSSIGEQNFGRRPWPDHTGRYARAEEFLDVVTKLWDSWEAGAVLNDREAGRFADISKIHPIDHEGEHFAVAGPLNVTRTPQGRPVIVQAGSSDAGRNLASRHADMVFTAQQELDGAVAFRTDIRRRAEGFGRSPDEVAVMPGICPIVAEDARSAHEVQESLLDLIDEPTALARLADQLGGADLSGLDLDEPIPPERLPEVVSIERRRSRYAVFRRLAVEERWTLRRLIRHEAAAYGHGVVAGSAEQIADRLQEWFEHGAADGFVVIPPYQRGLELFFERVVAELQDRKLFRTEYEGTTLREHLGVPVPKNRWTS